MRFTHHNDRQATIRYYVRFSAERISLFETEAGGTMVANARMVFSRPSTFNSSSSCCGSICARDPDGDSACCSLGKSSRKQRAYDDDLYSSRQVEYARVCATTNAGTYHRRGVISVATSWCNGQRSRTGARSREIPTMTQRTRSRRRDTMPIRHETDFSVLEFADYQDDPEYEDFLVSLRFASPNSETPTSLRRLTA